MKTVTVDDIKTGKYHGRNFNEHWYTFGNSVWVIGVWVDGTETIEYEGYERELDDVRDLLVIDQP